MASASLAWEVGASRLLVLTRERVLGLSRPYERFVARIRNSVCTYGLHSVRKLEAGSYGLLRRGAASGTHRLGGFVCVPPHVEFEDFSVQEVAQVGLSMFCSAFCQHNLSSRLLR